MALLKACLEPGCANLSERARCPMHRPKDTRRNRTRLAHMSTDWRWRKLSLAARARQPWCSTCGTSEDLTGEHIIPIDQAPELAYEPLNIDVLCRSHNSRKSGNVSDEQRAAVYRAIAERNSQPQAIL